DHVEDFGNVLMEVRRDDCAGLHHEVQHDGPELIVGVADRERDVALAGEGKTIRLDLAVEDFLIDHRALLRLVMAGPATGGTIRRRAISGWRRHLYFVCRPSIV